MAYGFSGNDKSKDSMADARAADRASVSGYSGGSARGASSTSSPSQSSNRGGTTSSSSNKGSTATAAGRGANAATGRSSTGGTATGFGGGGSATSRGSTATAASRGANAASKASTANAGGRFGGPSSVGRGFGGAVNSRYGGNAAVGTSPTSTMSTRGLGTATGATPRDMELASTRRTAENASMTNYARAGIDRMAALNAGKRIGEIKSMGDLAYMNVREAIKPAEAGIKDPYNRMVHGGPLSHNPGLSNGTMTLGDVKNMQAGMLAQGYASTAVGAYQTIDTTLAAAAKRMGLPDSTVMTEKTWDAIADNLISNRVEQTRAKNGGKLTETELADALAHEWAAFKSPKTGKGAYDKVGKNMATVPAERVSALARDVINQGYSERFASTYLGGQRGPSIGNPVDNERTGTGISGTTSAPKSTPTSSVDRPAVPANRPAVQTNGPIPKQIEIQKPTKQNPYKRTGTGQVAAGVMDAIVSTTGPLGMVAQGVSLLTTGTTVGGNVWDASHGKYGENQHKPGDTPESRGGTARSSRPAATGTTGTAEDGGAGAETPAEAFVAKYVEYTDPTWKSPTLSWRDNLDTTSTWKEPKYNFEPPTAPFTFRRD